jgi:hypothetical protein
VIPDCGHYISRAGLLPAQSFARRGSAAAARAVVVAIASTFAR